MKFPGLVLTCLFFFIKSNAQDCSNFYYLQDNKTIEMTITNKKGNLAGRNLYSISNASSNGNSKTATMHSEFFDSKGKSIIKSDNNIKCVNGVIMMDMKVFIPASQQEQIITSNIKADEAYLEYPAGMKVGDNLKDGQYKIEFENSSGLKSSVDVSITERKVEGQESVTTSAGTWDCFKISANNKITTRIAGIGIPIKTNITEWFAPGFGVVKTESAGGKTEITSIK